MSICLISSPDSSEKLFEMTTIFCWYKKATNGSSFYALQKKAVMKKLVTNSWISS
jgi:hypothetical protein